MLTISPNYPAVHPGTLVSDWRTMSGLDVNALPERVIFDYIHLASE